MRNVGRALGVAAALGAVALWAAFVFVNPYARPALAHITFGLLMMLAGLIAAGAAARGAHLGMYLLFFASFFPVGLSTMLGPGIFKAIGWLNLSYLAGAVVVHRAIRTEKRKGSS